MTEQETALRDLLAKGTDASFLREMIGFAAERLMEPEVGGLYRPRLVDTWLQPTRRVPRLKAGPGERHWAA